MNSLVAKLNRGPHNGKRVAIGQYQESFYIMEEPSKRFFNFGYPEQESFVDFRRGEYRRSHSKLKDGTIIFEWMGWIAS